MPAITLDDLDRMFATAWDAPRCIVEVDFGLNDSKGRAVGCYVALCSSTKSRENPDYPVGSLAEYYVYLPNKKVDWEATEVLRKTKPLPERWSYSHGPGVDIHATRDGSGFGASHSVPELKGRALKSRAGLLEHINSRISKSYARYAKQCESTPQ